MEMEENNVVNTNNNSSNEQEKEAEEEASSTKAGGWKSIKYIIGNESFEKLASMSLMTNLIIYLTNNYYLSGLYVTNVMSIWNGTSNIASIAGAFISEAYLGRFQTLLYGCIASLLGILTVTLTAGIHQLRPVSCNDIQTPSCQHPQGWQLGVLFAGLGLLSIGAGGIRPCNIAFGADQFDSKTEKGRKQLESFFNWWYFTFTVALIIAFAGVGYIQTNVSWTLGFAIPTMCLAFSIAIFLLGRKTYIYKKPQGSIFTDMAKVITAAFRKCKLQISDGNLYDPVSTLSESENIRLVKTDRFKFLDKAAIISDPSELNNEGIAKNSWRLCNVQQVEHLKSLLGILPVWVTGICCFIVKDQNNNFGGLQFLQFDSFIGHFKIPQSWMSLTSMITLTIWIYIYECVYIPIMRRINKSATKRISMGYRIRTGILFSILCMLVAALGEKKRRDSALKHDLFISPVSFGLLLPQFALSGLSEATAIVAVMEYLTLQLPVSLRSVAGAVFFLSMGIADYIGFLIVNVVHRATSHKGQTPWLGGHDLNHIRLDYYYYLIASLGVLNFIYFHFFACHYLTSSKDTKKAEVQHDDEEKVLEMVGTT